MLSEAQPSRRKAPHEEEDGLPDQLLKGWRAGAVGGLVMNPDVKSNNQGPPKRPCLLGKSGAARRRPIESTLTVFLEKYGISKEEWDAGAGRLRDKGIAMLPPLLPWPEGLALEDGPFSNFMA
jgi:hypothetical protein